MRTLQHAGIIALASLICCVAALAALSSPVLAASPSSTPTNIVTDSSSAHAPTLGDSVTFTASVTGPSGAPTPTGAVAWLVSGTAGTTACKSSTKQLSVGSATCIITTSRTGTYIVTESYGGNATYAKTTSASDTATVNQATASDVVTNSTSPSTPAVIGSSVKFLVTISGPIGAAKASGALIWSVSGSAGTTACRSSTKTLGAQGTGSCVVTTSKAGTYLVSAAYGGDADYTSMTSIPDAVTVVALPIPGDIVTNSTNLGMAMVGSSITFTATVFAPSGAGGPTPTGGVTWSVSGTAGATACKSSTSALTAGQATCTIATSSVGGYIVTDTYAGNGTYAGTSSAADTVTTTSLSVPTNVVTNSTAAGSSNVGTTVTFSATLSGGAGTTVPTGKVTWSVSGTAGSALCATSTRTLAAGVASCTLITAQAGTYVVTDTYAGNSIYGTSASIGDTVTVAGAVPNSIPVLDWHELNNGCESTAVVCNASDPESVSTTQLTGELSYLVSQGYHTVTPAQYESWTEGAPTLLPLNPILLIADNGILPFLSGAQPILKADGFTMAVAVISGFADGASGVCSEPTYEPGCPSANDHGWDATWAQLAALSPSVYNFIIEAGAAGHFVQTYDSACTAFYACEVPGETSAAYEARVESELSAGQAEVIAKLGASRFTNGLWVIPYSDDGYAACSLSSCVPQTYDGPAGWLTMWTAEHFPVAFVQDAFRNGTQNERFRIDVQGWMTQDEFETMLSSDIAVGDFTLAKTPTPTPTDVVTDSTSTVPATIGGAVTFTATVSGPAEVAAPTGTVTWSVAGPAGAATCATSTTALTAAGNATCTVATSAAGNYRITSSYGGDANYAVASSTADTVSVPQGTPTNVVTDSVTKAPATLGGSVTFTATVSGPVGLVTPTGSVSWSIRGTAGATACTTSATTLVAGGATCTVTTNSGGTYVASDAYGGDVNYTVASSAADVVALAPSTSTVPVAAIPVLSWDSTTTSLAQVRLELAYLTSMGDNTVSAATYANWAQGNTVELPANPILITVTGGLDSFLSAVTIELLNDGYSAVDFVSTQAADVGGSSATWAQLAVLSAAAWQFSLSSGDLGGTPVTTDPSSCNIYYACEAPGEAAAAYESRVADEVGAGRLELDNVLWMQTVSDSLWSPPLGDVGQPGAAYNGPAGWLSLWASYVFAVVFVPGGASGESEHNALFITGATTEASFESTLQNDQSNGTFSG
jgi:hypothetical protein